MKKTIKRVLIVLGILLAAVLIYFGAQFLRVRAAMSRMTPEPIPAGEAVDEAIAATQAGQVRGYITDGIFSYRGIPYAEAKERFVPAQAVTPWEGVRDATEYGAASPQGAILGGSASGDDTGDNNCQNLNLWTPGLNDGAKRPVMVWLHGGGFSSGSANDALYDGTNLAKYGDVVVVGVNSRLNVYGFLDLSAYDEKYQYSGNVGVMDLVSALEWIENNIEAFGGDPENITVFGQSGGGAKVLSLMSSPYAQGHFQKGIVQSGATETMGVSFSSQEQSARLTEHLLAELGIAPEELDKLQTISNSQLQEAATAALQATAEEFQIPQSLGDGYAMEWGPVIDGDYLPTNPVTEEGFAEAGRDVPLLIGSNLNEWSGFTGGAEASEVVAAAFAEAYPNEEISTAGMVDSTIIRLPLLKIMSHKADQNGANVYAYVFTRQVGDYGSYHGAEIPFVFRNTQEESGLVDTVSSAWVSFARSGVPSAEGLEEWKPYTREDGATMILDEESYLAHGHDRALMELLAPGYEY